MKSPSYILVALLPLASQLTAATPVAEPHFDSLEERGGGNDKGYGDHRGYGDTNVCEVKRTYPYYKYPCDSSPSNGTSLLGATFTSFCKYQNSDSGVWYSAPRGWVKEEDKPRRCPGASNPCPV
ncbi:hypothetical protein N7499_009915 [Penicillium canescens]|uniref:Uncharacterized protein n=1 Tax=Penicillium canescens TaxID=5083 RepID=A0AAD6IN82_PENCN|nr:uncharacterized protein N7446_008069 [Penicillium canescens]KAJ6018908.1 hypothetical protein N7522_000975 [Penicillium canescens]KAJ6033639.1 hypothetical protein N7444_011410 [Penicillium canescens]KAJ6057171.1 hypothetical protein N7460_000445 [Penicillium canescens]KAJ6058486.1 hypothetical protein N7446_008069 [Penicillium canescens]KAJ6071901.1 hypothetical protein N7499_009915 [Penicillium canescens]